MGGEGAGVAIPGADALTKGWTAPELRLVVGELPPDPAGVVERTAVRAVIRRGEQILMVHSPVAGDYKFPGGGVEAGESLVVALDREVHEECGRAVTGIEGVLLVVDERRPGIEPSWVLRMSSVYVGCAVGGVEHDRALDDYERELAFHATWITPVEALRVNEAVLTAGSAQPWVAREIAVLRVLTRGW